MQQNKHNIIFISTGKIGIPLLGALAGDERFDIKLVITQVDKPAGRKMQMMPSPIKIAASDLGLRIYQPENINNEESLDQINAINPDMIVLMAYGQILKKELLSIPKFGCINVHASLLPKYRGASPIQQSLLNQDKVIGISIMEMEETMDTGPVFKTSDLPIEKSDDAITLTNRLANLTAYETPNILDNIIKGYAEASPQDDALASYCQKISKSDGQIDCSEDSNQIAAKIRAFTGWPGTFTFWNGKRLKIINGKADEFTSAPGLVSEKDHLIMVGTGKGSVILDKVQLEGKSVQSIDEFIKGYGDFVGSELK